MGNLTVQYQAEYGQSMQIISKSYREQAGEVMGIMGNGSKDGEQRGWLDDDDEVLFIL